MSAPAVADDVYLENGRVFEDVIAVVEGDRVHLHLAFGEMSVPLHTVDRIVEADSSLEELERRRHGLQSDPSAQASEWLALARWARARGLDHGARQAALEAARRDAAAPGLPELMRALGYVFDPATGSWMPYEERMRRRGYERIDGRWLSPEEQLAREREMREEARMLRAEEESRLTRAVLALAAASLANEAPPPPAPRPIYSWPWGGTGVVVGPGYVPHRPRRPHPRPRAHPDPAAIPIERRQPGSLLPIAGSHRGSLERPRSVSGASRTSVAGSGG